MLDDFILHLFIWGDVDLDFYQSHFYSYEIFFEHPYPYLYLYVLADVTPFQVAEFTEQVFSFSGPTQAQQALDDYSFLLLVLRI